MRKIPVRRSISLPQDMSELLAQIAARQDRRVTVNDLIREAVRQYIETQQQALGSRRYFQKSLRERVDQLEDALTFQLNMLTYLVASLFEAERDAAITEAIIAARQHGERLREQLDAVRAIEDQP